MVHQRSLGVGELKAFPGANNKERNKNRSPQRKLKTKERSLAAGERKRKILGVGKLQNKRRSDVSPLTVTKAFFEPL